MSDTHGEGWWQASDGQWYPPEQHPDYQAGATQPIEATPPPPPMPPPTAAMPPVAPMPPPGGAPMGPPTGPMGPPTGPVGPPPGAPGGPSNNAKWIIVGVLAVAAVAVAAFLLLGGDDKKKEIGLELEPSSSSTSSSSSRSSSSSSRSTTTSSSSSSSQLSQADLQARMLTAKDIGPGFIDGTFTPDNGPTNCGEPNPNQTIPPKGDLGSRSSNGVAAFQEEAIAYNSSGDAQKIMDIFKAQTDKSSCPNPTVAGGAPIALSQPRDVSSSVTTPVEEIIEIDFELEEGTGQFFVVKDGVAIVTFNFFIQNGADTSQLPSAISLVNKGLNKIVNG